MAENGLYHKNALFEDTSQYTEGYVRGMLGVCLGYVRGMLGEC